MATEHACLLCGKPGPLRWGHVIPKAVGAWIRKTSATGTLRNSANPNRPLQDLPTFPMLSDCCEERFSKHESLAISRVWAPLVASETPQRVQYDSSLLYLAVSICWRIFASTPWAGEHEDIVLAARTWADWLLGKRPSLDPYRVYVVATPSTIVRVQAAGAPRRLNHYLTRTVDGGFFDEPDGRFVFAKLPRLMFWGAITPSMYAPLRQRRLRSSGVLRVGRRITLDEGISRFVFRRADNMNAGAQRMSPQQVERTRQKMANRGSLAGGSLTVVADEADKAIKEHMARPV